MTAKQIISKNQKSFKFTHPYDNNSDLYVTINITVTELFNTKYNKYYYNVYYDNIFSEGESTICHPLYNNYKTHLDGDIVVKNKITEALVEYLLFDDQELSKYSGSTSVMSYRGAIMRNIANLWD